MSGNILAAKNGAGRWRFPEDEFVKAQQRPVELFPNPKHDIFDRRVLDKLVEILVIDNLQHAIAHHPLDSLEILDHASRRSSAAYRAAYRHLESVGMPMQPRTFPGVKRQRVRGLEAEMLANLDLKLSLRPHRFQTPLQVGEEAAGDVTIDNPVVEGKA